MPTVWEGNLYRGKPMIEDHKFRPTQSPEGFSLSRDRSMHRKLMNEAERRLRDNREWLVPVVGVDHKPIARP